MCVNISRRVNVLYNGTSVYGTAVGITENGRLIIDTDNGRITVSSGEVSVRGIYGYV